MEQAMVEVLAQFRITEHLGGCSRRYSPTATGKPQVPQAGSTITSRGVGSVIATISSMMWRGVRN